MSDAWPPSLKKLTERVFRDCPANKKEIASAALKKHITSAITSNLLWSTRWDQITIHQLTGDSPLAPPPTSFKPFSLTSSSAGKHVHNAPLPTFKRAMNQNPPLPDERPPPPPPPSTVPKGQPPLPPPYTPPPRPGFKPQTPQVPSFNPNQTYIPFGKENPKGKLQQQERKLTKGEKKRLKKKNAENNQKEKPFGVSMANSRVEKLKAEGRLNRFKDCAKRQMESDDEEAFVATHVVGTSTNLEKRYFRLTSDPRPSDIRTEATLYKSFEHVKRKWVEAQNYDWTSDQLKAIRQDLVVQNIKNALTISVYETHARLALETADVSQFNQCHTKLIELQPTGLVSDKILAEFLSYNLLYSVYTRNDRNLNAKMTFLASKPTLLTSESIQHSLNVVRAVKNNDFTAFFEAMEDAPNMSCYFLDLLTDRVRMRALKSMSAAYRPVLSLLGLTNLLYFDTEEEAHTWLIEKNIPLTPNKDLDFRAIGSAISAMTGQKQEVMHVSTSH